MFRRIEEDRIQHTDYNCRADQVNMVHFFLRILLNSFSICHWYLYS